MPGAVAVIRFPAGAAAPVAHLARRRTRDIALDRALSERGTAHAHRLLAEILWIDEPAEGFELLRNASTSTTMGRRPRPCVVYHHHKMQSGDYRRFNITGITPGDDTRRCARVLTRRYEKVAAGGAPGRTLILIDGGKGTGREARQVLAEVGSRTSGRRGQGMRNVPGLETLAGSSTGGPT